jgi:NurA-like 5'-3' nuclease
MEAITVALLTVVGAVLVALVEKGRKENKADHGVVSDKLDIIGKSLGRSIDRVEETVIRNEVKLDQHIRDHVKGDA